MMDPMTGLPDRSAFEDALATAVSRANKAGDPVSVIVIDIDLFGKINEKYGHAAGDTVIATLVSQANPSFRREESGTQDALITAASDPLATDCSSVASVLPGRTAGDRLRNPSFPKTASCYRCGGDAIAVLLESVEKEQAFLLAEAFRKAFDVPQLVQVEGKEIELRATLSMGLASFPDDGAKAVEVLNKAFEALYRAKVTGRNKVCLAREEKMVTKTSHYMQGQLMGLRRLAEREGIGEANLLREALNELLRKYNA
jgi:GGDEF domain-containing protein